MAHIKEISITFGGKVNLGNYESGTVEMSLVATLAQGDNPAAIEQQLWESAQASVAIQVAALGRPGAGSAFTQLAQKVTTPAVSPHAEPPITAYSSNEAPESSDDLWDERPVSAAAGWVPSGRPLVKSGPDYPLCPIHNVKMYPSKKTAGDFYHKLDGGGYCEQKGAK